MSYLERMIDLRETHNFTQAYVAGYLQIAQNTYSDYERGKVRPTVNVLIALAKLYDVDMNYMAGSQSQKSPLSSYVM